MQKACARKTKWLKRSEDEDVHIKYIRDSSLIIQGYHHKKARRRSGQESGKCTSLGKHATPKAVCLQARRSQEPVQIINILHETGATSVCEITASLKQKNQTNSHHLARYERIIELSIVVVDRPGKEYDITLNSLFLLLRGNTHISSIGTCDHTSRGAVCTKRVIPESNIIMISNNCNHTTPYTRTGSREKRPERKDGHITVFQRL